MYTEAVLTLINNEFMHVMMIKEAEDKILLN